MNFESKDCDMVGDGDLVDDNNAFTPSASTEDATTRNNRPSASTKNEYDLDMDDTEETKDDRISMPNQVPVEPDFR